MELTPILDPGSDEALYIQLYRSIREDILNGRIPPGSRLPSIRKLGSRLGLSRTPVSLAYEQLQAEGYLRSVPRSGLFAAELEGLQPLSAKRPTGDIRQASVDRPTGSDGLEQAENSRTAYSGAPSLTQPAPPAPSPLRAYHAPPGSMAGVDFGYGAVDLNSFPLIRWKRLLNRSFQPENARTLLYGELQGEAGLRGQIAAYLHQTRGVRCSPEDIVIGAGTYHSLDLLFQLLEGKVTALASEEAVNDGVHTLFRRFGYTDRRLIPLPLEKDGIKLGPLIGSQAQAVYVTPSHQFPYGMTLSAGKRLQLLQWARDTGSTIIENDYDGEFRYGGRPIPSLQGMDTDGRVVYIGTFSKALTPSFRLSYMVLPPALLALFRSGRHSYDQLASPLFQETLRLFMVDGDLERHMRRMRGLYQKKHDLLVEEIHSRFGDAAEVIGAGSGLHILLKLRNGLQESEMISRAAGLSVRVYPASVYALHPDRTAASTVLLGFGGLSGQEISTGVRLLSEAWLK
jgi:GntR family transcriptional regulator / MocR family aminotransferase